MMEFLNHISTQRGTSYYVEFLNHISTQRGTSYYDGVPKSYLHTERDKLL
jgi:hypothetical protein